MDSTVDTLTHIKRVNSLMLEFAAELLKRAEVHDQSKLEEPEKSTFDKITPLLKDLTYGSDEYKKIMQENMVAIRHHQQNNSHHPEFYAEGINGMTLLDLVELFLDWKAASERHADGNIYKSIAHNKDRFKISDQLCRILENTASYFFDKYSE